MSLEFKFLIAVGISLLLCHEQASAWRSFKIVFGSIEYEHKAELVDLKIQISNTTGETALNVVINLLEDISDVNISFAISLESEDEVQYMTIVNNTLNFCNFLKQRSQEPFLRLIYEDMVRQGNFFKTCPLKKGLYTLHEYRLDEELLPSYLPETNFIVRLALARAQHERIFNGTLTGRVDKSKGFNNLKMFSLG